MEKPVIGITMGDACGVGPEIIMKALADEHIYTFCRPLVIGDLKILARAGGIVGSRLKLRRAAPDDFGAFTPGEAACLDLDLLSPDLPFGQVLGSAGDAAYQFVKTATLLALEGRIQAVCTAPLNKEALHLGGHIYPGHTEILAELCGAPDYAMMFASPQMNVILVTTHVGLLDSVAQVAPERVLSRIRLGAQAMQQLGCARPRIAVCGINPHAGEGGMFGRREEEEKILPAIRQACAAGLDVAGPFPADTIFYRAVRGDFDLVVAMYHDQGLIAVKTVGMETAVNITVGLPIVRTSVDHGTAFDIAGRGIADAANLKHALQKAAQMGQYEPKGE